MKNIEIWKDIPQYEGFYQASNMGRIRSVLRTIYPNGRGSYVVRGKIIKPFMGRTSKYLCVALSKNGIAKKYLVHILVSWAFYGIHEKMLEINHKDGNIYNNRVSNLELVTHIENIRHAIVTGLTKQNGEKSVRAALTNEQAATIRKLWSFGVKQNILARIYHVHKQTISNIINFKTYIK